MIDFSSHEAFLALQSWIAKVGNLVVLTHLTQVSLASVTASAVYRFEIETPKSRNLALYPDLVFNLVASAASISTFIAAVTTAISFVDCE